MQDRIKELRKTLGLTLKEFAEKIGRSFQVIQKYENGDIKPNESTMLLISSVFNVNFDWLAGGDGEIFKKISLMEVTREEREFIELYRSLSQGERDVIMGIAKNSQLVHQFQNNSKQVNKNSKVLNNTGTINGINILNGDK